jgi:hypothetical protein
VDNGKEHPSLDTEVQLDALKKMYVHFSFVATAFFFHFSQV